MGKFDDQLGERTQAEILASRTHMSAWMSASELVSSSCGWIGAGSVVGGDGGVELHIRDSADEI